MKVIERGILPEEKLYRVRCTNCSSLFEFQRKEAKYIEGAVGSSGTLDVKCPVEGCGHMNKADVLNIYSPRFVGGRD